VPVFYRAENLAKALKASMFFHKARQSGRSAPAKASRSLAQAIAGKEPPGLQEGLEMLARAGIPVARGGLAQTQEEAVRIAGQIGYPVVLKADSPDLPHKTELGLIKAGLNSKAELESALRDMEQKLQHMKKPASFKGFLVQEMVQGGVEVIIGITREPQMGPVLLFGLGGIFTEVMKDFSLRVCPVSRADVREMVREIKGFRLLEGFRGSPPADVSALEKALLDVSRLAMAMQDRVREIDINPLLVLPKGQGVRAIDALFVKG
jgi:acetyltransferase